MRLAIWAVLGALALSGCSQQTAPAWGGLPPSKIAGPQDPFWKSVFVSSEPERAPGDMTLTFAGFGQPGAVQFSRGLVLQTRPVRRPEPDEPYNSRSVETWADLFVLPAGSEVEVRQVVSEATPPGGTGLCAGAPTTWIAIGLSPRRGQPGAVSIAAFSGADVPGRETAGSQVCAVHAYAAPS